MVWQRNLFHHFCHVCSVSFWNFQIWSLSNTCARYALPYFSARSNPAIVISYITPGNAFPVTEDSQEKESLSGYFFFPSPKFSNFPSIVRFFFISSPRIPNIPFVIENPNLEMNGTVLIFCSLGIVSGYNSHYVVVNKAGLIPNSEERSSADLFDEVVIPQESQITPVYVLRIQAGELDAALHRWQSTKRTRRSSDMSEFTLDESFMMDSETITPNSFGFASKIQQSLGLLKVPERV